MKEKPTDTHDLDRDRSADLRRKIQGPLARPLEPAAPTGASDTSWYLEAALDASHTRRIFVVALPFRVGRRPDLELVLPVPSVSTLHAEIYAQGGTLHVRDLDSTNGTFHNRKEVEDAPLREGDVIHFADMEFRLGRETEETRSRKQSQQGKEPSTSIRQGGLSQHFVQGTRELKEMIRDAAVTVYYQPIVLLPGGRVVAYEALGRGRQPGLSESPLDLFQIAETMGAEAELSRLLRHTAVKLVAGRADIPTLFLNTHPKELSEPGLLESLEDLRVLAPYLDLALEIHESVLTHVSVIKELKTLLTERNIALAYDDFGAGQSRLLELAEAPPHYLKFDRRFIDGIDAASPSKRHLLASLVSTARDLLVKTVAEGIETAAEAEVCARLGFTHAQGYYFGRPMPVEKLPG